MVGFLAVCFLYKINPNQRKIACRGKKLPKCHFSPIFSWVGLALGWVVRRFHTIIYTFPTQQKLAVRKHPIVKPSDIGPFLSCGGPVTRKCFEQLQARLPYRVLSLFVFSVAFYVSCLIAFHLFGCPYMGRTLPSTTLVRWHTISKAQNGALKRVTLGGGMCWFVCLLFYFLCA